MNHKSEDEIKVCRHQYTKGQLRGKFCGKMFSDRAKSYNGLCSEHRKLINHELYQCIGMVRDGVDDLNGVKKFTYLPCQELTSSYTHRCSKHRSNDTAKYRKPSQAKLAASLEKTLDKIEEKKNLISDLEFLTSFNL